MHLPLRGTTSPLTRLVAGIAATALGVGLSIAGAPAAHAAETYFCADDTQPYAPVADVEAFAAGTAVTGLSVTNGTTPSEFTGSYIGYIDNGIGLNKDLLLFVLHSDVIDGTGADGLKPAGIWAGMSGSPVYTTDGALIGAVSYSLNYDNLPVAGVTPAEYMAAIGSNVVGTSSRVKMTNANLKVSAAGIKVAGTGLAGSSLSEVKTVNVAGGTGAATNAFVNRTFARTPRTPGTSLLRSRSFTAAAAQSTSVTAPLVAGGTVAALYADADLVAGAIGTVTAVCGDTVYAFGHPMDFEGRTTLLMANASTALIVPDGTGLVGSYKQVSAFGAPVGMVTQDRLAGIRGTVGDVTGTPISLTVQNPAGDTVDSFHTTVGYSAVTASAVAALIGEAAYQQLDEYYSGTGEVSWTIDYRRADGTDASLSATQVVADSEYFADTIATEPADDVWAIQYNDFEDVTITGVSVTMKLTSDDALTYRPSGVQIQDSAGTWGSLDGSRLKAGRTYSLRPEYTLQKNGANTTTVDAGDPVTIRLAKKARKSGSYKVSATSQSGGDCEEDFDGTIVCYSWDEDGSSFASFDDLVSSLEAPTSNAAVTGRLAYKLTRGSKTMTSDWTGPGVVNGSVREHFTIRK